MYSNKLKEILNDHHNWINDNPSGKKANLKCADLKVADLEGANLKGADLEGADLEGSNLKGANLKGANLKGATINGANLEGANLNGADLEGADLRDADLRDADLDFSCLPLWCGSVGMRIDDRLAKQFVYHAICNLNDEQMGEFISNPIKYANEFHRVGDVDKLKEVEE